MTTALDSALPLDDGGDLVAAVPHLLGFDPADSLVVLTLHDEDRLNLGAVFRVDLPPQRHRLALARHLADLAVAHDADRAAVVVVGGAPDTGDPPHRALVTRVSRAFAGERVPVDHAVWTPSVEPGSRWSCYSHTGCGGTVPDSHASALAVSMLVRGAVRYPSREALAATLEPDPPELLAERAGRIDALAGRSFPLSLVDSALALFVHADDPKSDQMGDVVLDLYHSHTPAADVVSALDEETVATLGAALLDPAVRGYCQTVALTAHAAAAERLWTYLTRALPAPDRAEPACLLAVSAYLRGNGPLARVAVDAAVAACPGHHMAALLTAVMDGAMTPSELRSLLTRASQL